MKKRTIWKRALSLILALAICMSLPMTALADEIEGTVDVETTAGSTEAVDVTITIESTSAEGVTNEVITTVAEGAVTESGMSVDYQGISDMTTVSDGSDSIADNSDDTSAGSDSIADNSDDASVGSDSITTGTENTSYTVENADGTYGAEGGSELEQEAVAPEVTVDVPLEENTSDTAAGDETGTVISTTGDEQTSPEDGTYDYTTETIVQQGEVTVTTTDITTENLTEDQQEYDYQEDLDYVRSEATPSEDNDLFVETYSAAVIPENKEDLPQAADGYSYVYMGSENSSEYFAATLFTTPQYDGELPTYTVNGVDYYTGRTGITKETYEKYLETGKGIHAGFVVDGLYIDGEKVSDEKHAMAWGSVQQFLMMNEETGEMNTVYCADQRTFAQDGYSYNIENLEDASYYSEEEAAHIRTIAENGYWGTGEGVGSLENMQDMMRQAKDTDGNAVFTEEEIALLNDGVAMTATQFAIWNYSNVANHVKYVNVNYINSGDSMAKGVSSYSQMGDVPADKKGEEALIFKLSNYLINMEPTGIEEPTTSNTVMTSENFVSDLSVTVVEKAENHANNQDSDTGNDAYVTDLSFALVVTPSTENGDDMIVKIISNGEVLKEARIAGNAREGETLDQLTADESGNYTVTGIVMTEGDQQFNITLEGIQNLKEGVYLYTSEIRDEVDENGDTYQETSQTMVGMASGEHAVNVSMTINFDLDVDDEVVATERVWREEWTKPSEPPKEPPQEPPQEPAEPDETSGEIPVYEEPVPYRMYRPETDEESVIIPDEEIPLADAPSTGDISAIYAAFAAVSALGLAGLSLNRKRDEV